MMNCCSFPTVVSASKTVTLLKLLLVIFIGLNNVRETVAEDGSSAINLILNFDWFLSNVSVRFM